MLDMNLIIFYKKKRYQPLRYLLTYKLEELKYLDSSLLSICVSFFFSFHLLYVYVRLYYVRYTNIYIWKEINSPTLKFSFSSSFSMYVRLFVFLFCLVLFFFSFVFVIKKNIFSYQEETSTWTIQIFLFNKKSMVDHRWFRKFSIDVRTIGWTDKRSV